MRITHLHGPEPFRLVSAEERQRCYDILDSCYSSEDTSEWPDLRDVAIEHGFELALCQYVFGDLCIDRLNETEKES